jgi:Rieske Fe-S protein
MPADDLQNEQGEVLTDKHIAIYRDAQGQLHAITSVCTHRGCDVRWNDEEKVWDCPCHGSRFGATGEVLRGPAQTPLAAVDIPK